METKVEQHYYVLENGIIIQRVNSSPYWFVIVENKIVDYSQYRNDLFEKYGEPVREVGVEHI